LSPAHINNYGGFSMKRFLMSTLLAFGIAGLAAAQNWGGRGFWGIGQMPVAESVTVSGSLTIVQGAPAVKSGDITYLLPGLMRYAGFIDSLKDGAQVKLEGAAITSPQDAKTKILRVSKLGIGGKDYDLARPQPPANAQPMMPGRQMTPMQGRGRR
jgi:hypothetical protein